MKISVVIPTYNEAGGIKDLLAELLQALKTAPEHQWSIVVVDGNSPDGTGAIVAEAQRSHPDIHLIEEAGKRGIALSYLTGIEYATHTLGADAFAEFDGDGQHNPSDLPRLAFALERGYDYAVGSRYIPGGGIPENWGLHRKFLSQFGSLYSRILLEVPVHDVTSGLKMTRIEGFVDALPRSPEQLLSRHYAYKIQFLYAMYQAGARITEVPIVFRDRKYDSSKSTVRDILESLKVTTILRLTTFRQWRLPRVVAIGAIGFVIQAAVLEVLGIRLALVPASIAAVAGGELAILSNFVFNERFGFRDIARKASASIMKRLVRFHIVSSGSILTQWLLLFVAEQITHDATLLRITFGVGVILGFAVNYVGYYFYVWNRDHER